MLNGKEGRLLRRNNDKDTRMKINILLCDDDKDFLQRISDAVAGQPVPPGASICITKSSNPAEITDRQLSQYHIMFLDIDMDERSGMDIARRVRELHLDTVIVFVTNYPEFSMEGYEVRAFRYLLKQELEQKLANYFRDALAELPRDDKVLRFSASAESFNIPYKDILYLESNQRVIYLYTVKPMQVPDRFYAVLKPNAKQYKKLSCPQIAAQCSIQTKSVERVFRGERTTLKTAQEIAAALKCKPEKLFHIELDHRPIARKTIKEYAIFLRLVMQYAEREYGIDNDTQTLAVKGTRSRPVDCLHPEEVEALFKVLPRCSTLEQVIVMGLLNTGMRRGELAGLTWEDIDFDHCTVHVDKSLLIVNKGYHLTTTKEDNVRDIDVAPEFMEYLKTYRDQWLAQKHRMGSAWQTCMDGKWESYRESLQKLRGKNFIVINDFGWPISPDHYGKIVDRVAEKAGIRKIHPHMFRHTFVSILLSNPDIGVATVAAEAGHAQPSTTLAIYTQVYHKRQDSIRSQMSETLYKRKTPER